MGKTLMKEKLYNTGTKFMKQILYIQHMHEIYERDIVHNVYQNTSGHTHSLAIKWGRGCMHKLPQFSSNTG